MIFDENHDWIEPTRATLYPKLHPYLKRIGGFGVGNVYENQYVCTLPVGEESFEEILVEHGWERNPIAAYKTHDDGRNSEGSWRLRYEDDEYDLIEKEDFQLHITLFNSTEEGHIDVYCHKEYDWMKAPLKHLNESDFSAESGVNDCKVFIKDFTYLKWYDKNE